MRWPWTRRTPDVLRVLEATNVDLHLALARIKATEAELTRAIAGNQEMIRMIRLIRENRDKVDV